MLKDTNKCRNCNYVNGHQNGPDKYFFADNVDDEDDGDVQQDEDDASPDAEGKQHRWPLFSDSMYEADIYDDV